MRWPMPTATRAYCWPAEAENRAATPGEAGLGSAIVSLSMQQFSAVDLAILATVAASRSQALVRAGRSVADVTILGYRFAYAVAIGGTLVGLTLAVTALRERRPP